NGVRAGAMSDVSAFSFYPTKILGGYGDGGMVVTSQTEVAERLRRLRMYGMSGARPVSSAAQGLDAPGLHSVYYAQEAGFNSRLDELHAAILRTKLPKLDRY